MTVAAQMDLKRSSTLPYGAAIFISAFLLFQVQLIVGKYFLPWFGGTPSTWTTCMFFFQVMLVGGYLYAYLITKYLDPLLQRSLHILVVAGTLGLLLFSTMKWHSPIMPDASWKPGGPGSPVWHLSVLLGISVGVPFLTLSTTGPLLQSWVSMIRPSAPYRLYALSNLGSFAGLLSYPFVVEPWLSLKTQAWLWLTGFLAFSLCCGYCALQIKNKDLPRPIPVDAELLHHDSVSPPSLGRSLFWLMLAACGSLLFLATTNQICQNIAVVPLLWVFPLGIYLFSLVICFDRSRWYSRAVFHPAMALCLVLAIFLLNGGALTRPLVQIACYSLVLFVACMVCHGELARSKPVPQYLTLFYLIVASGGAVAAVFVILVAPKIFSSFWEYQLGLWLAVLLMFLGLMKDKDSWIYMTRVGLPALALVATLLPGSVMLAMHGRVGVDYLVLAIFVFVAVYIVASKSKSGFDKARAQAAPWFITAALLVLGFVLLLSTRLQLHGATLAVRNFYGTLTVRELQPGNPEWNAFGLNHGLVSHGFQFRSPSKSTIPTSYYGPDSGVGKAVSESRWSALGVRSPRHLRIGVIGLGVGTLAAYVGPQDSIRFYEINPAVIQIAGDPRYFTYLTECPAKLDIIAGDARLSMEREVAQNARQNFDLLVVDAFTGDAVPVHLLTKQAFQIYLAELKADGILAVHITNTYLDLRPVLAGVAEELSLDSVFVHSDGDNRTTKYSDWELLWARSSKHHLDLAEGREPQVTRSARLWTDDYSNLFELLR
jgi:spermidine synthase